MGFDDPTTALLLQGYRPRWLPARRGYAGREAGVYLKKPRHMNPCNVHALRRAIHRTDSFVHLFSKIVSLKKSGPRLKKHRGRFGRK